jgi:hypothetical protein
MNTGPRNRGRRATPSIDRLTDAADRLADRAHLGTFAHDLALRKWQEAAAEILLRALREGER